MIAVDTSALMAMVLNEPGAGACRAVASQRRGFVISAVTLAEALIVAHRASEAYSRWGKGVPPARLNLIDCFSYDAARSNDCPLLYVGRDFAQTGVVAAIRVDDPA